MGNLNVWKPLLSFFGFPNLPEANTVFQGGGLALFSLLRDSLKRWLQGPCGHGSRKHLKAVLFVRRGML